MNSKDVNVFPKYVMPSLRLTFGSREKDEALGDCGAQDTQQGTQCIHRIAVRL